MNPVDNKWAILPERTVMVFRLDGELYALGLTSVERVIRAVATTRLPGAPQIVRGIVNVNGQTRPVYDLRQRLGLPPHQTKLEDQMILAKTTRFAPILIVDEILGVETVEAESWSPVEAILEEKTRVEGVLQRRDGLVLIHDLKRFLTPGEEQCLQRAMDAHEESPR